MKNREFMPVHEFARQRGVTLAETLIAVAIVALLSGIIHMSLQTPVERQVANAVLIFIQDGRQESMASNSPVVVSYDAATKLFQSTRVDGESQTGCISGAQPGRTLALGEFGGLKATDTEFAVMWLPSGQPRSCPAGTELDADSGATFRVSGLSTTLTVGVSSEGQVRLY